jgi:predicted CxxxxCH...CXXCH cytochrome family protein
MTHRTRDCPTLTLVGLLAVSLTACADKRYILIDGSTCSTAVDCAAYASCGRRVEGCLCRGDQCYFDSRSPERDLEDDPAVGCRACHGSIANAAPPFAVNNNADPLTVQVGAHQTHLRGGHGAKPGSCEDCHLVPTETNSPGHIDSPLPAEVTWGGLAQLDGALPIWDPTTGTCTNTYCHGATMTGGYLTSPVWTALDGTQDACGTCHGLPPPLPHPVNAACELCHQPTAGPGLSFASPMTHIDGIVQVQTDCVSCHGQGPTSAPPLDLAAQSDTSRMGVGAHQTHRTGGEVSRPVGCTECHIVPANLDDPGHVDTPPPAEVTFGPLAKLAHVPVFAEPGCSDTYCHSGQGASVPQPIWNLVDGTQGACGACHGTPPATPVHQSATTGCANCHLPTAGQGLTVAERTTHVDGLVQASDVDCSSCHGGVDNPAPPKDLNGDTDPADREVGAHLVHFTGGAVSAPVACSSCHLVPQSLNDPGHVDTDPPAEVTFSGRAVLQGSVPTWRIDTRTCMSVYCHGVTSSGGTNVDPVWNAPGSVICGTCHGLPPDPPHPQSTRCELCHAPTAGPGMTIADRSHHVDGTVDVNDQIPCASCHGSTTNAAPPKDLAGNNTSAKVGAHQQHIAGTARSKAVPCDECHNPVAPSTPNQAGHYDSAPPAELTWGVLARTGGLSPTWSGAACSNTYCHGASLTGATDTAPQWTAAARTCDDCHGMPPNDADHGNGTATQCESCHPDVAGPGQTIINKNRHVDGVLDTSAACDSCHGGAGDPTPPTDTLGASVSNAVGVHRAHESPTIGADVPCVSCHKVPVNYGDAGHVDTALPAEVIFTGRSIADGATTASWSASLWRCSNTYCHGATLAGGKTVVYWNVYTHADRACGACHGMPPTTAGHAGVSGPDTCDVCHQDTAGPSQTILPAGRALHGDGIVQVNGGGCTACHASPPTPTDQDYANGGGAHAQHAAAGIECITCHGNNGSGPTHNPSSRTAPSLANRNEVNVVFATSLTFPAGTSMRNGQASATWTQSTQTCKVGCHNPVNGNPNETPNLTRTVTWTGAAPGCVGCHDTVPSDRPNNHPISTLGDAGCLTCHSSAGHTTGAMAFKDPDPTDGFAYAPGNIDGLCKTCHDSGTTTAFGGVRPQDVVTKWSLSSHAGQQYKCVRCHTYHATAGGPPLFDRRSSACTTAGCHDDKLADFQKVAGGPISHHKIEGGTGIAVGCNDCHNAHVAQASPNAAINPTSRWTIYAMPATAVTSRTRSYNAFCTNCHGPTPPAGVTGAKQPNAVTWPGAGSGHMSGAHGGQYGCPNCHGWHGTDGTAGINRGRLIRSNVMGVNNQPYGGKSTCAASGTRPGTSFSCH